MLLLGFDLQVKVVTALEDSLDLGRLFFDDWFPRHCTIFVHF